MTIGFYFDFCHLTNFDLDDFFAGKKGVSGTDSSFFRVVQGLSELGLDIVLLAKGEVKGGSTRIVGVKSFHEATQKAISDGYSKLISVYKEGEDLKSGIALAESSSLNIAIWAQNPITKGYLELFSKSRAVSHIVFVEQFDPNHIRHHALFNKSIVIPNGVEKEVYATPIREAADNTICFLGSLTYTKGFHLLAEAWPKVREKIRDAKLIVLGSGKLYDNKAILGPLGLADRQYEEQHIMPFLGHSKEQLEQNGVVLHGLVNRNQLIELLPSCKAVCINPNVYGSLESCSVSSLEAQMLGVPVVGGASGGNLCTIVHGETGFLARPEELHLYLIKLLSNGGLNREMRAKARQHCLEKYELKHVLALWQKFLQGNPTEIDSLRPIITKQILDKRIVVKQAIRLLTLNGKLL